MLYMLGQRELARTLLPVGELTKAEVRAHAARLGLRTAAKPESMDVCFITRGGREAFLAARVPRAPGAVVDTDGTTVGSHDGVATFTSGSGAASASRPGSGATSSTSTRRRATVTIGRRDDLLRDAIGVRDLVFAGATRRRRRPHR